MDRKTTHKGIYEIWRDKELSFLLYLQEHVRSSIGNRFWLLVTTWGNGSFGWLILGGVLSILPWSRDAAARTFETIFVGEFVINVVIKRLCARTRPYDVCDRLCVIGKRMHDTSFPSGHTCMSFLLFFVYLGTMPWWFAGGIFAIGCLIGFSRMYLGVHYPSDVAGGVAIGGLLAVGMRMGVFPLLDAWLG